jgi:peptidoglycan/xylan/chitin deacetylase (PgdA/CDA1 family)
LTGRTWTWTTVQASSANAACQWTPTVAGTYRLLVWARDDTSGNREFAGEQTVRIRNAGETPPANVAIAPFQANRAAAVSYTFDDGTRNQYRVGVPVFDQYALRATFNIVGHYTPDDAGTGDTASWAEWRMILPRGHEIGNHSLDHLDLTTCTTAQLTTQIESNAQLTAEKLGAAPISFALPHTKGNAAIYQTILRTHVGVRGQQQYVNYGGAGFTAAKANALVDAAIAECRWMVPVLHGVDDTTYMPIGSTVLRDHLAYVQGRDVWVETFGTVSRYVLERDHAMLTVTDEAAHHLTFTITTPLDATLYDVPLTVLVGPLAALPLHVQVYRSGDAALLTTQVTGRAGAYLIQVEVVPGPLPVAVTWE